jgi:hypothetical protein
MNLANVDKKFATAKSCKNIGVLLPESDSSARLVNRTESDSATPGFLFAIAQPVY